MSDRRSHLSSVAGLLRRPSATLSLCLLLLLAQQSGLAQSTRPVSFFKNYFVSGNYVVGGVDLAPVSGSGGFVTGEIHFNNAEANAVPPDADIVGALLYWQTITTGPLPQTGLMFRDTDISIYAKQVSSQLLNPNTAPCWSGGGGQGATYTMSVHRADVLRFLPIPTDANGVPIGKRLINDSDLNQSYPNAPNGFGPITVTLPDAGTGNQVPQTAGASLVVIYRLPTESLKGIVVYDGLDIKGPAQPTMTHTIKGFYEATSSPSAKLTYIVGGGAPNGTEQLQFNASPNAFFTETDPFVGANSPGSDRGWDYPTRDVSDFMSGLTETNYGQEVPVSVTHGNLSPYDCLATSAIIFSTEVKDADFDGLLDIWETNVSTTTQPTNQPLLDPTNVALPDLPAMGASPTVQDVFVEVGFMHYLDQPGDGYDTPLGHVDEHTHLPTEAVLNQVAAVFENAKNAGGTRKNPADPSQTKTGPIKIHFDVGDRYQGNANVIDSDFAEGGDEIVETACIQGNGNSGCQFPGFRGVVGWKLGFRALRDQPLGPLTNNQPPSEEECQDLGVACERRFSENRRHMFRYVLFAHALGVAREDDLSTGDVDESLFPRSISGVSDAGNGGGDLMVTLGLWDGFTGTEFMQVSTIVHELGHTMGLRHGGSAPTPANPAPNCKPNYQSVMSYLFQVRGLITQTGPKVDLSRQVLKIVQQSNGQQVLNDLNELSLTETALRQGTAAALYPTRWYAAKNGSYLDNLVGTSASTRHCDGTLITDAEKPALDLIGGMVRVDGTFPIGAIDWNASGTLGDLPASPDNKQDINFSGKTGDLATDGLFTGWNDWEHLDLRQTASRRNPASLSLEIQIEDLAGAGDPGYGAPGQGDPGYGDPGYGDPGYGDPGYGDPGYGDPGYGDPGYGDPGYGDPGYGGEIDVPGAESQGPGPNNLTFTTTNKSIDLKWTAPHVGKVDEYHVWRATGTISPTNLPTDITPGGIAPGTICNATTGAIFCDTNTSRRTPYQYFVTATFEPNENNEVKKSGRSNIITAQR